MKRPTSNRDYKQTPMYVDHPMYAMYPGRNNYSKDRPDLQDKTPVVQDGIVGRFIDSKQQTDNFREALRRHAVDDIKQSKYEEG